MPDWSWLDQEEDKVLNTFNGIQFIRCYAHTGERFCSLYTVEGFKRIIKKPVYYGKIDTLDITTQWGSNSYSDIELDAIRKKEGVELTVLDTYDFSAEGRLECKLTENRRTGNIILYCQDEE